MGAEQESYAAVASGHGLRGIDPHRDQRQPVAVEQRVGIRVRRVRVVVGLELEAHREDLCNDRDAFRISETLSASKSRKHHYRTVGLAPLPRRSTPAVREAIVDDNKAAVAAAHRHERRVGRALAPGAVARAVGVGAALLVLVVGHGRGGRPEVREGRGERPVAPGARPERRDALVVMRRHVDAAPLRALLPPADPDHHARPATRQHNLAARQLEHLGHDAPLACHGAADVVLRAPANPCLAQIRAPVHRVVHVPAPSKKSVNRKGDRVKRNV